MALSLYGGTVTPASGSNPVTQSLGAAAAVGDLLLCYIEINNPSPTVTDNVNSGVWTQVPGTGTHDSTLVAYFYWFYKICNTAGTPTVTATSSGAYTTRMNVVGITGFVGTPSFDGLNTQYQNGSGITANTTQTANYAGEILVAQWDANASYFNGLPSNGWQEWGGVGAGDWHNVEVGPLTLGANANTSYSANASTYWVQSLVGVYDLQAPTSYPMTSSMEF